MEHPRVFGEGAVQADATTLRIEQERIAEWMQEFTGPGYGPWGNHKLLDDAVYDERTLLRSPASGLREMRLEHAAVEPYRDLVGQVQSAVGDGGTTALLLATELMVGAYRMHADGAAWPRILDGLALARRQSLARMRSMRKDASAAEALAASGPEGWGEAIVDGLAAMGEHLDLESIDIRAADVPAPRWSDGVHIEPQENPRGEPVEGRVLLVDQGAKLSLSHDWATHVIRDPAHIEMAAETREAQIQRVIEQIQAHGVVLVVCREGIDDRLGFRLVSRGIIVQDEAPDSLIERLASATGARCVASSEVATPEDLGDARVTCNAVRIGGWRVRGAGPGRTLHIPHMSATLAAAAQDDAERLLRAAGAVLASPGALEGGGAWQADLHEHLERASAAADGHAAFGVQVAADAFDALRAHLVRNAGKDPLDVRVLTPVQDPYVCMRHAVDSAFALVEGMLRLDGRFEKKQSDPTMLRGLQEATHTARQNNDVPPWM